MWGIRVLHEVDMLLWWDKKTLDLRKIMKDCFESSQTLTVCMTMGIAYDFPEPLFLTIRMKILMLSSQNVCEGLMR